MVELHDIEKARTDSGAANDIHDVLFYDAHGNPKVRMWLVKKGVPISDLDDVESDLKLTLAWCIKDYKHGKIPFEKFAWTVFSYVLTNWFNKKKANKNTLVSYGYDENAGKMDEVDYYIGNLTDDFCFDFESVISILPCKAKTVARIMYYNGWNKREMMKYYHFRRDEIDSYLMMIAKVIKDYQVD
jgi:hypothetical protein